MKKKLYPVFIAAVALLFAACEEDAIWDYASASMLVRITDDAGINLLDTTQAGNFFEKGMGTLTFPSRDASEPIRTLPEYLESFATRAYMGPWAGAVLTTDKEDGSAVLFIGEFNEYSGSGEISLTEELFGDPGKRELTLDFADGRSVTVSYSHSAGLNHKLKTKAKVIEKSDGLNVSIDFATKYTAEYLHPAQ